MKGAVSHARIMHEIGWQVIDIGDLADALSTDMYSLIPQRLDGW